ncbi:MAG: hypothetical protein KF690_04700 [Bacteroidetes bacterium]|nr:hypothetical protein [Bacteroidota bacterium]
MLRIQAAALSPRLQYVAQVLGLLLGVPVQLVPTADASVPHITYGSAETTDIPSIAAGTLLAEEGLRHAPVQWTTWEGLPVLQREGDPPGDPLASVFLLLSDYFLYAPTFPQDTHGRPDETCHPLVMAGLQRRPLVHEYAQRLIEVVQRVWPRWHAALPQPDYLITVDIDEPWEYRHKPFIRQVGGLAKDLLAWEWKDAAQRLKVLAGGADRYDPLPLFAQWPADKLRTFWLAGGRHPRDNRFSLDFAPLRALLAYTRQRGIDMGPHPSYETSRQPDLLNAELQAFARVTGQKAIQSRQHYLRMALPQTLQQLAAAGVLEEYAAGFSSTTGFAHGMAVSFPWYDLPEERMSTLWRVPFQVMDRTLQQYMKLDVEAAIAHTKALREDTHRWGGTFTVLLHNHILGNAREWRGWHRWHSALNTSLR